MADTKISALTALTGANLVADDDFPVVDSSTVTTKRIEASEVAVGLALLYGGRLTVNTVATTGATETLTSADIQRMTMDQNCTFTFPTPAGTGHGFILVLSGAFTPTFPAAVDWDSGGGAPTYATPSWYTFITADSGTTWLGTLVASGLA
jgi:hypothetical protein